MPDFEPLAQFTIPGVPHGKGRPRFSRRGPHVRTHTDPKTASYEAVVRQFAALAMGGRMPTADAVQLRVRIECQVPASWSQKKRAACLRHDLQPTGKPDGDNVAKAIADALNGIVYTDDSRIVDWLIQKFFAERDAVTVTVNTVGPSAR